MYKATFDRVAQYFSRNQYADEFASAREDYFRRTGKVFEDEPMYENRITAFLEWYLLDRLLADSGIPPVRLYRLVHSESLDHKERDVLAGLEKSVHSLFSFSDRQKNQIVVKDLLGGGTYRVAERNVFPGIERGDVLDTRVMRIGNETIFSDAMWLHPSDAVEFISRESKKKRAEPPDLRRAFLFDLAYMKLKRDRFSHVPTKQIYDWNLFRRDRNETERRSAERAEA